MPRISDYNPKKSLSLPVRDSQHKSVEGNGSRVSSAEQSIPMRDGRSDGSGGNPTPKLNSQKKTNE